MSYKSIKELAKETGVSYEAIRKMIDNYKHRELSGHIIQKGRGKLLDDFAQGFIKEHQASGRTVILDISKDKQIDELKKEKEQLLQQVALLQDRVIKMQDDRTNMQLELNSIKLQIKEKNTELDRYKPFLFGLYKKEK